MFRTLSLIVILMTLQATAVHGRELVSSDPSPTTPKKEQTSKPVLRIILFTPSDVEPPKGTKDRMKQIVDYTQTFFAKWMKHWGYTCPDPLAVKRDSKGYPEILYVKGEHTFASGKYRQLGFQRDVVNAASKQYNISLKGEVWWVFMYKGPERNWGRGMGDLKRGGISTARFFIEPGQIKTTDQMAAGFLREIMIKGAIHELGHALGLPHIGPKECDKLGNSLMGPVNRAYASQKGPKDQRVYLSQASAAMLSKHPLFTGTTKDRNRTPKVKLNNLQVTYQKEKNQIVITGKIDSDYPAHSVIVANEQQRLREYWLKTFVGKVDKEGAFKVIINEYKQADGKLQIMFSFNNGAIVGEKRGRGFTGGFTRTYRYSEGEFEFKAAS